MKKIFLFLAAILSLNLMATEGALNGKFTINASGDQIVFSKGNLQYVGTWQFATNQWDTIGGAQADDNRDLFGWGTGDAPNKFSSNAADYATFTDWGTNPITNGGNEADLWRTLTKDEWVYLFATRENAATLFALGCVNGVNGVILLPDNWNTPTGASFTASTTRGMAWTEDSYTHDEGHFGDNDYPTEAWAVMEANGAVFLPAAGLRYNFSPVVGDVGLLGEYWSATPKPGGIQGYIFTFTEAGLWPQSNDVLNNGCSVRLVQAAPIETAIETPSLQGRSGEPHKRLVNGQLLIEKNEKIYNAQGAEVR